MCLVKTQGRRLAVTWHAGRLWCQVAFPAAVHVAALPVSAIAHVPKHTILQKDRKALHEVGRIV